nr:hypothetical protein [Tolivirales sp.]
MSYNFGQFIYSQKGFEGAAKFGTRIYANDGLLKAGQFAAGVVTATPFAAAAASVAQPIIYGVAAYQAGKAIYDFIF